MDLSTLQDAVQKITKLTQELTQEAGQLQQWVGHVGITADPFVGYLTIFVLACFVGYYVVWHVTPSLHSPLMSVTNAISSIIIVGALIAAGPDISDGSSHLGLMAVLFASINIFGGFVITHRMLSMFSRKEK